MEASSGAGEAKAGRPQVRVSLGDAVLYDADLGLLSSPSAWLNDHCVLFWQQWLLHRPRVAGAAAWEVLQPAAAFTMQFLSTEDLLADTHDNVFARLKTAALVLVPIVSDADAEGGGGSHWTLLAFNRSQPGSVFHLDSARAGGASVPPAFAQTAAALKPLLGLQDASAYAPVSLECGQQRNAHDCGVFLCAFAESLVDSFLTCAPDTFDLQNAAQHLPKHVDGMRSRMLLAAQQLASSSPGTQDNSQDDSKSAAAESIP